MDFCDCGEYSSFGKKEGKNPNQTQTLSGFLLMFSKMKGIDCRKIAGQKFLPLAS